MWITQYCISLLVRNWEKKYFFFVVRFLCAMFCFVLSNLMSSAHWSAQKYYKFCTEWHLARDCLRRARQNLTKFYGKKKQLKSNQLKINGKGLFHNKLEHFLVAGEVFVRCFCMARLRQSWEYFFGVFSKSLVWNVTVFQFSNQKAWV